MDDFEHEDLDHGPLPPRAGPGLLLIPLLALVAGVLWARQWRVLPGGPRPAPPAGSADAFVQGWVGETIDQGTEIDARLAPMHADAGRQAFDSTALAHRLALEDGAPWRLVLSASDSGNGAPARPELPLAGIRVVDGDGVALRLLPSVPLPPGSQPADPVAVLVAPPEEPLTHGEEVSLVLWGRSPGSGARVVGLTDDPFELRRQDVPRRALEESLARLDPDVDHGPPPLPETRR